MLAGLLAASANAQITNGDFESGINTSWGHQQANGATATYSEETANPHGGSKALKAEVTAVTTQAWDAQSLGPSLTLDVGKDYTLKFWAKSAVAGQTLKVVLQNAGYSARNFSLTTTWTEYTWSFTATEASPQLKIHWFQVGTFWLDDFSHNIPNPGVNVQIGIAPQTQHQTMVGFGAALSWYTNWIYYGDDANDAAIEQLMFEDLGIDVIRFKNWYYPNNYPTNTDPTDLETQSAFDTTNRLHAAAKAANSDVQILLSSWSPPANLKSNDERSNGGTLKSDAGGFMYDELAQYWVDVLDNLGWSPEYLSFQNEPGWVASWDSCILRPTETATNAGYAEASDAIWNAIKDRPNVPKMLGSESENIGNSSWPDWNGGSAVNTFEALNTPLLTRPYVAAHGYHTYNIYNEATIDHTSTISRLRMIRDDFDDRPNWMTEWSKDGLDWLQTARVIHNTVVEANCASYIFWKLAWDGASNDTMIGLQVDGTYEIRPHYYMLKHYSKHVDMGDKRIKISSDDNSVKVSGYLSADNTRITLVAINKAIASRDIDLNHPSLPIGSIAGYQSVAGNFYQTMAGLDAAAPITLPASSMTTFVITLSEPYVMHSNIYLTWASGTFTNTFEDYYITHNDDGDLLTNFQEFAFGIDPTTTASPELSYVEGGALTQTGTPIITHDGSDYLAVFTRRKDHVAAGVTYTVNFSADLSLWTPSSTTPTLRTSGSDPGSYEVVSVPYPATVPVTGGGADQAPQFFRVQTTNTAQ